MSSTILYDEKFPHGTPGGFLAGCHAANCPADIPCRDVYRRHSGDYTFRKRYEGGMSLAQILEREREDAAAAAPSRSRTKDRIAARRAREQVNAEELARREAMIRELHAQGLQDKDIAPHVGLGKRQVCTIRTRLGLVAHRNINREKVRELHAQGLTDRQIGDLLGKDRRSIQSVRLYLKLPINREKK